MIPHRSEMQHLITGHSYGVNLQWLRASSGAKNWEQWHGLPLSGFDLYYSYTGNQQQLGQQAALSYLIKLPLRKSEKIQSKGNAYFQHNLGLGIGAGYSNRTWDLEENHQAQVIGSTLNAALTIEYSARLIQMKKHSLHIGLRLTHFSNGAFKLPNLGTNTISLHTSYQYGEARRSYQSILKENKQNVLQLSVLGGAKEITPPNGRKYASFTFNALYDRHTNAKNSFGVGTDVFFSNAVKALKNRFSETPIGWDQSAQLGVLLSYGLHFDRVVLRIQQGVYVWNVWEADGSLYQRVHLRYAVTKNIFCHIGLKTHFAKADHAELGLGYSFEKKQ